MKYKYNTLSVYFERAGPFGPNFNKCFVPASFSDEADYILSIINNNANQHLVDELHTTSNIKLLCCLAADYPFTMYYDNLSRFYRTTSHYLCHKICCHSYLVEIALGLPDNLMVCSQKFILPTG